MNNIIKVNSDFNILRYKHGWELHHWTDGKDKEGNDKRQLSRMSFHPNIETISKEIINRTMGECDSLAEIVNLLENASQIVTGCIEAKLKDLL
jgi:hypothetical protein